MLNFIIIFAAWATPGILLFLYLFYISKRAKGPRADLASPMPEVSAHTAQNDPRGHG